jgi:hypothetical protein
MRMVGIVYCAAFASLLTCTGAQSYERGTHVLLADRGIQGTQNMGRTLQDLGLNSVDTILTDRAVAQSIRNWLRQGAYDEDDTYSFPLTFGRYRNHFYDPTPGAPNNGGFTGIFPRLGLISLSGLPAPDWALEPTQISGQKFSYLDARDYFLKGLTESSRVDRERNLAQTFYALGHVVHTIQDLAQPQHTRNDSHAEGSFYEKFTDDAGGGEILNYTLTYIGGPIPAFSALRELWAEQARFSNNNFVSAGPGKNFRFSAGTWFPSKDYANPKPVGPTEVIPITQLPDVPPDVIAWCGQAPLCHMRFIGSKADDSNIVIPRAATFSIFTADLSVPTVPIADAGQVALNRYNFTPPFPNANSAHSLLIPRAVSYTAGLYDYFFRGKIDFSPDPTNAGQYLVKNLGTESMKGKFKLYYDDQDGNRNTVRDTGGQELVWDTDVILAASEGVLAAGASLPVPGFVPPSTPPPKTPGEYMLVFSGDMGEEKAEGGNVGAVVGKLIRNEYKGALYVVGVDANGVITSLRADKDGTKVLYGWDISKRDANNPNGVFVPPSINEFDPLGLLYGSSVAKPVRDKIYAYKQVEYGPGPVEYTATSVTLIGPDNPNSLRSHYGAGLGRVSFGQVIWIARSPDDQIGTFEFQIVNIRNVGRDADIQFTRRFKDTSGVSRVEIGGTSMPTLTFPFSYQLINGSSNPSSPGFPLVISDDGLTINGFATFGSLNTRIHARLVISLAQTPQVRLEQTTIAPIVSESGSFLTPPYQPAAPCSVDFRRAPDGVPITTTSNGFVRNRNNSFESSLTEEVLIGNLGGRIATYMREQLVKRTEVVDESICYAEGSDFDPATGLQRRKYSIRNTVDNDVKISGGTYERFVGGDYSLPSPNVPMESISMGQLKGGYPGSPFICLDCRWSEIYDGFDPVPSVQITLNPGVAFRREEVGRTVVRALTDRRADVIYGESASDTQAFIRKFRDIVLTGKEYVADSSPLGEVFFATSDKSDIIHDTVPGGMPRVRIPENVVKLLAALWM